MASFSSGSQGSVILGSTASSIGSGTSAAMTGEVAATDGGSGTDSAAGGRAAKREGGDGVGDAEPDAESESSRSTKGGDSGRGDMSARRRASVCGEGGARGLYADDGWSPGYARTMRSVTSVFIWTRGGVGRVESPEPRIYEGQYIGSKGRGTDHGQRSIVPSMHLRR